MERVLAELRQEQATGQYRVAEVVSETLYQERRRLAAPEDPVRAQVDQVLYDEVGAQLPSAGPERCLHLAQRLLEHYGREIEGHFDPQSYRLATRVLPPALALLLHGVEPTQVLRSLVDRGESLRAALDERLLISGQVERLQRLARLGTVLLVPTHQSHLDSVLVGYAIYRMGLPPFVYGAGLNLFTNPVLGQFLGRLGAYSVDRRKHNRLYLSMLMAYATVSLEQGQHHLFFPGGTRSRSGALETHLKLGLLGAAGAAYGNNLRAGKARPQVFVVPCTCSYPLVLEGQSLIEDHLRALAGGRYIPLPDEAEQWKSWAHLLRSIVGLELRVHVRIGAPLDPFGNAVDDDGISRDPRGRPLAAAAYLQRRGQLVVDRARDAEYTRYLAQCLVKAYQRDNTIAATHLLAYAVLERQRRRRPGGDWVRFLRGLRADSCLPRQEVLHEVQLLREALLARAGRGELQLDAEVLREPAERLLTRACTTFASFHTRPALYEQGDQVYVGDENLTFFYRNRLAGYRLSSSAAQPHGAYP